ncbi:MAG TPA: hypothetical protein VL175_13650, partial [Pirellulales bacterium]|nr:hypothetical protein [Pirellulales bacterium]
MQFLTAPVSGRIAGLAADPTDPNVLYAAAAGGGVWKTIDAGASWAALTDSQQTLSMGAIAVAPSDASVIYAGTGEANFSGDSFYGRGVLVSHDFGANWVLTGNNEFDRRAISKIAIDPTNSSIAYAAVARAANGASGFGVYKTIDAGVHWANTTSAVTTTVSFTDVAIDPSDSNILYAAVGEVSGNAANGVYKSINAGGSWTLLANLPHGAQDGRITIAVAPTNADEIFVSIAGNSFDSGVFSFQRSDDGGDNWTDLTATTPNYLADQGGYDTTLIVDPSNPAIVYAAGQAGPNSIIQSTDAGVSWNDIETDMNLVRPHVDHHAFAFDASGKLLDGNDGGVWRLDDPDAGSLVWTNLNSNLGVTQFEGVALSPTDPNLVLGGTQDNGTIRYTGTQDWTETDGGDGGMVKFSQQNPSRVYHIAPVESFGGTRFFRRSDDGGAHWTSKTSGLNDGAGTLFYPPFVVDQNDGNHLLLGADRIYETTNGADSWAAINAPGVNGWPASPSVQAIGLAESNPNTIYAATGGNNIFVTTDKVNWTLSFLPVGNSVRDIQVDPTNSQIAYAVVDGFQAAGHVFRTTNGGSTWTSISGNLPNLPTRTLQIDPVKANTLYIGNDDGVYVTTNLGATWTPLGSGLPHATVFQLDLNRDYDILVAGTHGRGAWEISVVSNVAPTLDLNGGGAGTGYSTTWSNTGAVNISDTAAAVTGDDSGNLA